MAEDVTQLLNLLNSGDSKAWDRLLPVIYEELRQMATAKMAAERPGQTLQPTALINEAYLRLVGGDSGVSWENRRHFFAAASEAMRRVLVDSARRRLTEKRGGGRRQEVELHDLAGPQTPDELVELSDALDRLHEVRPEIAELVKLRYFGGFTGKQAAECLSVSPRTADNYWAYAKAFLLKELEAAG